MIKNYSHCVSIEERDGVSFIRLYRAIEGRKDFYTEIKLVQSTDGVDWDEFERLSSLLGKSLLIDSPMARLRFGIEAEADKNEKGELG